MSEANHPTPDQRCAWHEHDSPLESGAEAGCSNCSMLIATKQCEGCGGLFFDWEYRGSDDVLSGPYATSDGDLVCEFCCEQAEEREREAIEDDYDGDYDPYDEVGESRFGLPGGGKSL